MELTILNTKIAHKNDPMLCFEIVLSLSVEDFFTKYQFFIIDTVKTIDQFGKIVLEPFISQLLNWPAVLLL